MSKDWFQDVLDFHEKLAPEIIRREPTLPGEVNESYCLGFIEEEVRELKEAANGYPGDALPKIADSLADIIYVAIRCAIIHGIDLRPVWEEVHKANMLKEGGHKREDKKILKPPGWVPSDIAGVLARQKPITLRGDKTNE